MNAASINITEDGEVMGTLHQFARSLDLSRSDILHYVHDRMSDGVILDAGEGRDRLLILDAASFEVLLCKANVKPQSARVRMPVCP